MKKQIIFSVLAIAVAALPALSMAQTIRPSNRPYANPTASPRATTSANKVVSNAKVTGISGSMVAAQSGSGQTMKNWQIEITGSTLILNKDRSKHLSIGDIKMGDMINADGRIVAQGSGSNPTKVAATVVRDLSR